MTSQENILVIVRSVLAPLPIVREKKMFGKRAFMVNDKLCIAIGKEEIMCRINPGLHASLLDRKECEPVIMKGREMKGYVYIKNTYLQEAKEIQYWMDICLEYNKTIS